MGLLKKILYKLAGTSEEQKSYLCQIKMNMMTHQILIIMIMKLKSIKDNHIAIVEVKI